MYYATELFIKKGALRKIWLAGTIFKKLSKKAILESDIQDLCHQVIEPPVPLAISTCGRLALGIVRIHDKITHYLLLEATEAQAKLRTIVIKSAINLPIHRLRGRPDQITIHRVENIADLADIDLVQADFLERTMVVDKPDAEALLAGPDEISLEDRTILPMMEDRRPMDMDYEMELGREEHLIDLEYPISYSRSPTTFTKHDEIKEDFSLQISEVPVAADHPHYSVTPQQPPITFKPFPEEKEATVAELAAQLIPSKREGRRRFPRDNVIEYKDDERLIADEKWDGHLIDRPQFVHLSERKLDENGFERLLTTSLTGLIPRNSAIAKTYSLFSHHVVEPTAPQPQPPQPFLTDIRTPVARDIIPSEIMLPFSVETGREATAEKKSSRHTTPSVQPLIFERKEDEMSISSRFEPIHEDVARLEITRPGEQIPTVTSSDESLPSELTHLSAIFRELIQHKVDAMKAQGKTKLEIDFEELLKEAAAGNNAQLNRHDVALGFLQVLILKNEDIIKVHQAKYFDPIIITKGSQFEQRRKQK